MDPQDYTGKEWTDLLREMTPKQLKKAMRSAIRAASRKALKIAQGKLLSDGPQVKGNTADWKKGIRNRVYPDSKGSGFLITVKARGANRQGKGEKGMHENRKGIKKPILMWAEEGTKYRSTKTQTKWFIRKKKGHRTGRMPGYHFLQKAEPEMRGTVEKDLTPEVEKAVEKVARKCGMI